MSNAFKSLSHSIEWTETLPNDFVGVRLPGGSIYAATGGFGYLCIQEYAIEDFTIYYKVYSVKDDFVLDSSRLPEKDFCRIHRGYIVNLHKVSRIHRDRLQIGNRELPVGSVFYRELIKKLSIIS